jgi:hypothetical protein
MLGQNMSVRIETTLHQKKSNEGQLYRHELTVKPVAEINPASRV